MKTKKWRDVKNALVMVVVMAAMMSTATYAWFTLTNDATVTGMQMTAGGSSGLQVSNDRANWSDSIDLNALLPDNADPNQTIHQVNVPTAVAQFYKPRYVDNKVTAVDLIDGDVTTYVAKYSYYLRALEGDNVNVGIKTATGTVATDGSYIRATDPNDNSSAVAAVRVGIVVEGSDRMYIFEPNKDVTIANTVEGTDYAVDNSSAAAATPDVSATKAGLISADPDTYVSDTLFTTNSGTGKEITMYVWLEGTDPECVNQIQADAIAGQMTFTIIN